MKMRKSLKTNLCEINYSESLENLAQATVSLLNKKIEEYKLFFKKELIGYNCNSLREQLVNSFIFNVRVTEKKADIKKEVATLLNVLKTGPVAISKG